MKNGKPTLKQIMYHEKFLLKHGAHPSQIQAIKKANTKKWEYDLGYTRFGKDGGTIPANGTKSPSMEREHSCKEKYVIGIPYNKGGYTVIPRSELKTMGKKL